MSNINLLLKDAKNELYSEPVVQEYFSLRQAIENDKELTELIAKRKEHQLLMCKNENNDAIYFENKDKYESLDSLIKENPLMINFKQVEEEVYELLLQVKKVLS